MGNIKMIIFVYAQFFLHDRVCVYYLPHIYYHAQRKIFAKINDVRLFQTLTCQKHTYKLKWMKNVKICQQLTHIRVLTNLKDFHLESKWHLTSSSKF